MLGRYLSILALALPAASVFASLSPVRSYFEARLPAVFSIQSHLEEVEHHLRAHPPAGLDAGQLAARAARLDDLRAYRLRGDFPHNLDFPDRVIPYFIDARGIACAVGHLMLLSGGADLAHEIARTRNHVYLPDERDPRLAEWARANGLTLEECARIQPSYAPHGQDIVGMALDSRNRPWVLTGVGISPTYMKLSYLDGRDWATPVSIYPVSFQQICMVGDRPLVVMTTGQVSWNGGAPGVPDGGLVGGGTCATTQESGTFWMGGNQGLRRYSVGASDAPKLEETLRAGVLPSDTVVRLAHGGNRIWVGAPKELASRSNAGGAWSSHSLGAVPGERLGGMAAGSKPGVWFGLLKSEPDRWRYHPAPPFSEAGLGWQDGGGATQRYHRGNSPLKSDTIWFAASGPDNSVWLTCDRENLLRFTPPNRWDSLPFSLPPAASSFDSDALGRLYIGTYGPGMSGSGASGLYRVAGNDLDSLSYPTGPISIARPDQRNPSRRPGWRYLPGGAGDGSRWLDLLGRFVRASD